MVAGATDVAQLVTLTNNGGTALTVGTISLSGANASNFTQSNTCSTSLTVGANCTVTVNFVASTSAAAGGYSATLNIPNSVTTGGTATVTLSGTVVAPAASLSPGAVNIPSMVAGGTSSAQVVTLSNPGGAALTISSIALSGTGANLFSKTTTCGTTLAAGANCAINITLAPLVAGTYSATLTVTDNASAGTTQTVVLSGTATPFVINVNTSSTTWTIDNGAIAYKWNSSSGNLISWILDGYTDQLIDTGNSTDGLYMDNTGSFANMSVPTGEPAATTTPACTYVGATITSGTTTCTQGTGSTPYFDWSLTIPDTANSGNNYTFVEHWLVFPNDPGVHTYVELIHSASDAAGSVGQVQWVFRDNTSIFTNTYEVNSGLGILGPEDVPLPAVSDTSSSDPGRAVQNATEDLHGFSDIPGTFGRSFETKYDYAGYEYLHQAHGLYGTASSGTTYGVWTVMPKLETLVGGPTKQNLWFTGNIDMIEAYSDHEDNPLDTLGLSTAAGVASNRLFGPFYIHVNVLGQAYNQTGNTLATQADMYADAISAGAANIPLYDKVTPLMAAGYTPSTGRGTVSIQMTGVTSLTGGATSNVAWAVLSDNATNFQVSTQGMQYWADITSTGATTFTGVVPGTYRLSVYVLGQWGEYRKDGIVVTANATTTVPTAAFVPENFAGTTGTTVFTIGKPDRSSHEFLHGHFATTANAHMVTGNDDREYWGNWNYWADFAANNGAVVYYATAVGSTPATNNLAQWNYMHWNSFDPGLFATIYSSSDDTTDGYTYAIPVYVKGLTGESGTNGVNTPIPAWQVYFATPSPVPTTGYVDLSIALACGYSSDVVTLNTTQRIWHYTNYSDCMIRSGLSGYTQWFVMEFPVSALTQTAGGSNELTISMSSSGYGVEDDALRLEISPTGANPTTTLWNDYTYITGTNYPGTGTVNSSGLYNNDAVPNP
jgi:hypothetical protein